VADRIYRALKYNAPSDFEMLDLSHICL